MHMSKRRKKQNLNRRKEKLFFAENHPDSEEKNQYLPEIDTELFTKFVNHVDQEDRNNHSQPGRPVLRFGLNLSKLIDETLEVFTMSGPITGTLLAARIDYLSLMDSSNTCTLIPYKSIEYLIVQ
jgi:hypothetical protein